MDVGDRNSPARINDFQPSRRLNPPPNFVTCSPAAAMTLMASSHPESAAASASGIAPPPRLLDVMRARMRRLGLSLRTEEAYVSWVRRFIRRRWRRCCFCIARCWSCHYRGWTASTARMERKAACGAAVVSGFASRHQHSGVTFLCGHSGMTFLRGNDGLSAPGVARGRRAKTTLHPATPAAVPAARPRPIPPARATRPHRPWPRCAAAAGRARSAGTGQRPASCGTGNRRCR